MLRTIARQARATYTRFTRRRVFENIYRQNLWGNAESVSGRGSSLSATANVREGLPRIISEFGIRTMLDAPCGDFFWMSQVNLSLDKYIGADIVRKLIESNARQYPPEKRQFVVLDVVKDQLPEVDLVLCRHLLIHLPLSDCLRVLRNFQRSGAKYLLITHQPHVTENAEKETGSFRPVNLQLSPFAFPAPLATISDAMEPGDAAVLALYRLPDLQIR